MKLATRLVLLSLVALAPAVAILGYNEAVTRRAREDEVRELALRNAAQAASEIDRIVQGARAVLTAVAQVDAVQALDTPNCVAYLARLQPEVPHLVSIAAIDREGRLRCRQAIPENAPIYADRPYIQEALATDQFTLGAFTQARIAAKPVLPMAAPLRNARGEVVGVVAAALDLAWLGERLRERGVPDGGSVTVADRDGIILAREPSPGRFVGTRIPDPYLPLVNAAESGAQDVESQDGTRRVIGYVPVAKPPFGLYVSAGLSSEASFAPVERQSRQGLIVILAGALLALAGAALFGRRFLARPIRRLLAAAEAWGRGEMTARTGLTARDGELGALAEGFERMAAAVAEREERRRESEGRFRELADSAPVLIWMSDETKAGVFFSRPWLDFTGRPLSHELGAGWLDNVHPKDLPALDACGRAFERREPFRVEFRLRRHDGAWRWMLDTGVPRFSPDGAFRGFIGSCVDITERKRDEARQRLLVNELNHRVKNTLATVQSLAAQTLRSSDGLERFGEAFQARLLALSKTHDLLTAERWEGASLTRLLEHEVAPYAGPADRGRVSLEGEDLHLPPRHVVALGLAVHELATNAAKYGALSREGGRVELRWLVLERAGEPRLRIDWRERGGPPVSAPTRTGFGSRLVDRTIRAELQGEVEPSFAPEGVSVRIEVPLPGRGHETPFEEWPAEDARHVA